jgi:hypothetical protein
MNYEVEVIREALLKSHIRSLIYTDPEDWDKWEAEFIVNYIRTHGYRLSSLEKEISFDD